MSQRFHFAVAVVSYGVVAMSLIAVFVVNAANLKAAATLEIRLAETQPATGLVEATMADSNKKIYLHAFAVITNEDISQARVVNGDNANRFNVGVVVNQQGSEKMGNATESHLGKPVAILVDGDVIAAPILMGVVTRKALIIGDWTKAQADAIAAVLNEK